MKKNCIKLFSIFIIPFFLIACSSEKDTRYINRKWRLDTSNMQGQFTDFKNDLMDDVKEKEKKEFIDNFMTEQSVVWIKGMEGWKLEFKPDGTRISTTEKGVITGKYAFSKNLDSLKFLSADNQVVETFKLVSLSESELIFTKKMPLISDDKLFEVEYRYVPE